MGTTCSWQITEDKNYQLCLSNVHIKSKYPDMKMPDDFGMDTTCSWQMTGDKDYQLFKQCSNKVEISRHEDA
ncbi:hypothetical protein TNCV_4887571 [Trichonephila clavipes]|nr:hypothetical protein TNCV_4887571 [Trichonephila clavipes]